MSEQPHDGPARRVSWILRCPSSPRRWRRAASFAGLCARDNRSSPAIFWPKWASKRRLPEVEAKSHRAHRKPSLCGRPPMASRVHAPIARVHAKASVTGTKCQDPRPTLENATVPTSSSRSAEPAAPSTPSLRCRPRRRDHPSQLSRSPPRCTLRGAGRRSARDHSWRGRRAKIAAPSASPRALSTHSETHASSPCDRSTMRRFRSQLAQHSAGFAPL